MTNANHASQPHEVARGRFIRLLSSNGWEYASRTKATGVVGILARTTEGKVLLIEQFRIPVGRRVVEIPAGLAGDNGERESLETAAQRELLEETGHDASAFIRLGEFPTSAGLTDEVITLFASNNARRVGEPVGDGDEEITLHLVAPEAIAAFLAARIAAGSLVDAKIHAALLLARGLPGTGF